ncbi:MAG: sensory rhodopsin transducer [Nostocoides sp.]
MVLRATAPVVAQHTRIDTRQAANSMMSTIAFSTR